MFCLVYFIDQNVPHAAKWDKLSRPRIFCYLQKLRWKLQSDAMSKLYFSLKVIILRINWELWLKVCFFLAFCVTNEIPMTMISWRTVVGLALIIRTTSFFQPRSTLSAHTAEPCCFRTKKDTKWMRVKQEQREKLKRNQSTDTIKSAFILCWGALSNGNHFHRQTKGQ